MTHLRTRAARFGAALVAGTLALGGLTLAAAPASAAARVTVANEHGKAQADTTYSTRVTLRGTGFRSLSGGFGGVYVVFGWVDDPAGGSWRPSKGGQTGLDYLYVPDSEAKDNAGFQRFVAYPGSDTAGSANGGVVGADGSWSTTLVIPGPTFQAADRSGTVKTVDCLKVQCGVITMGAHGVVNAANETFTPVEFVDLAASGAGDAAGDDEDATAGAGATAAPAATDAPTADAPTADEPAEVTTALTSVVRGRVLAFTGRGFAAGEQVVGSLSGGQAGVGPLTAGPYGEVAGVVAVPATLVPGTTTFTLTGAASGQVADVAVTVIEDPAVAAARANAEQDAGPSAVTWVLLALAVVLLALVVSGAIVARRHRVRAAASTTGPTTVVPTTAVPTTELPPAASSADPALGPVDPDLRATVEVAR